MSKAYTVSNGTQLLYMYCLVSSSKIHLRSGTKQHVRLYIVTIQYWSHSQVIHGLGMRPIHHRTSCVCVGIVEQPLHHTAVSVRLYSRLAYSRFAYFRPKSGRSRRNGRRQTGNIPILHGPYSVFMCYPASHAVMNLSSVNLLKSTMSSGDVRRSRVCPSSVW